MDKKEIKRKKIILTGGGTGGSVTPLLALSESLKEANYNLLFIGTKNGIEREMVKNKNIRYKWINAGKLRRYFSWDNFKDAAKVIAGFFESLVILTDEKPDLIISAGSFVSVPLVWSAWLFNVPVIIHQMDIRPGLANKIMAPAAKKITTVFKKSIKDYGKKAEWTGNPIEFSNNKETKDEIYNKFNLDINLPLIIVIGGGTGAVKLNSLLYNNLEQLVKKYQIIHITGIGKNDNKQNQINYHQIEFIESKKLLLLIASSDLVVSRAGIGVLSELSYFKKPTIIIPMPNSHQEDNADYFLQKGAAIVLNQNSLTNDEFIKSIDSVFNDKALKERLVKNIGEITKNNAINRILEIISEV